MEWVIQDTIIDTEMALKVKQACDQLNIRSRPAGVLPFVDKIDLPVEGDYIFWGSEKLVEIAWRNKYGPGLWQSDDFNTKTYHKHFADFMLNQQGEHCSLFDFIYTHKGASFVRSANHRKYFTSGVVDDRMEFLKKLEAEQVERGKLESIKVVFFPVKKVINEWRFLVIEGKIIDQSAYRVNGKRKDSNAVPLEAYRFAKICAERWTPQPVCIMDICESEGKYYIMEFNCFNCSGLYAMNPIRVVRSVNDYMMRVQNGNKKAA